VPTVDLETVRVGKIGESCRSAGADTPCGDVENLRPKSNPEVD